MIELEAENAYLRRELEALWSWFHAERCQRDWPHEGFCLLPRESILGNDWEKVADADRFTAGRVAYEA